MAKTGRPRLDDAKWMPELLERIAEGESVRAICGDEHMPHKDTVMSRLKEDPSFTEHYAKAREDAADKVFEDLLAIADEGQNDWMESNHPENPGYRANGEHIQRSRLRIDTRKWILARMNPKKYGDKMALDAKISGGLTINVQDTFEGEGE